jgi:hypothetical protein
MKIEIVLRTHDRSNVHKTSVIGIDVEPRYCHLEKKPLILGCIASLIRSTNQVEGHEISFKVLDDHSSDEFLVELEELFDKSKWPHELIHLKQHVLKFPFNDSALRAFEACRDSDADLVYSVEDDYLHEPGCIMEMIDTWQEFTRLSGREIVLFPFDMPDDYHPVPSPPSTIVYGPKRHWRTGLWTTNTFFMRPQLIMDNWELFEKLATEYDPTYSLPKEKQVSELNTICKIWLEGNALRFSPIPSIALHMQFERQKDPYINWEKWWQEYANLD